jgi:hypothetical protein
VVYRPTEWSYLARFDPEQARSRIMAAYTEAMGSRDDAAAILGVSVKRMNDLIRLLGLRRDVDILRESHGLNPAGGRAPARPVRRATK